VVADLVVAELVVVVTIEHVASPSSTSMRAPAAVAARARARRGGDAVVADLVVVVVVRWSPRWWRWSRAW
jgi:hypothetical protein